MTRPASSRAGRNRRFRRTDEPPVRPSARTLALDRPFAYVRAALSSRFFHGRRASSLVAGVSRGGANAGSKARCARESVYGMRFSRNHRNAAAIVAELAQDRRCVQAERLRPPHGRRLRVSAMRRRALRRGLAAAPAAIRPRQCASAASVDIALFVVPRVTDPEAFRQPGIGPAYDARDVYCRLATRTMRSTS